MALQFGGAPITTPEQAQRQRAVAAALIARSGTPAANWGQGLSDVASAITGTVLNNRASDAETAGATRVGGLFGGLNSGSSVDDIAALLANPDAAWANSAQSGVAEALLGAQLKQNDPAYQAQLANSLAGGDSPASVQEWEYYNGLAPEDQSRYLTMKRSNTPLNVGTGYVTQDMANPGQVLGGPIAIDNQTPAFDKALGGATGTAAGENQVSYDSVSSKLPGLRTVVDTLSKLADTATYTQSGQAMDAVKRELGLPVGQGAIDRTTYISMVDNQVLPLLRDTFGAAFTEREGQSLRATLGNPDVSPIEKKAILQSFIDQKERDVAAMASRMQDGASQAAAPATDGVIDWNDL